MIEVREIEQRAPYAIKKVLINPESIIKVVEDKRLNESLADQDRCILTLSTGRQSREMVGLGSMVEIKRILNRKKGKLLNG